ncbi:ATP-binding protein [Oribacterium asaccharolyticum]|uniref:ATP-binding protein n=1 Tax=Oribacterium asaccharolyticum TaxID=1501332 RepID=UPI0028EA1867|nr:ATP-binding protein [Oribacterium asaccharolyticum]
MALTAEQFHEIQEILSERRFRAEKEALEKQREVLEKVSGYADLDEKLRTLSISAMEKAQEGDAEAIRALRPAIQKIREEKRVLLEKAGFSPEDLEAHYSCTLCRDSGIFEGKKCRCFMKLQGEILYKQSKMGEILERENFSRFQLERFDNVERKTQTGNKTVREYMKDIRDYFYGYCQNYPENQGNFIFTGGTGTGKTFFLHCIAKALLDRGVSVLYFTAEGLFNHFSRLMREGIEDEFVEEVDVLLLDDLGTEFSNSFTASRFFNLLNQRILTRKTMMISTNLNFKDLRELYSDRVVSRMMSDYEIIPLYGRDLRLG